jgi:hypothetical protein
MKNFSDKTYGYSFGVPVVKCADSHPAITFKGITLYGGQARNPKHKDCDVYVCLQAGDSCGLASDPWEDQKVVEIHYPITDGGIPKDVTRFKLMIEYLCNQLHAGKKVHVGCIGGHGRTGLVLAAIIASLGEKDAITWLRKNYCAKAVETSLQVSFLAKYYGVTKVDGSQSLLDYKSYKHSYHGAAYDFESYSKSVMPDLEDTIVHMDNIRSIFRSPKNNI